MIDPISKLFLLKEFGDPKEVLEVVEIEEEHNLLIAVMRNGEEVERNYQGERFKLVTTAVKDGGYIHIPSQLTDDKRCYCGTRLDYLDSMQSARHSIHCYHVICEWIKMQRLKENVLYIIGIKQE